MISQKYLSRRAVENLACKAGPTGTAAVAVEPPNRLTVNHYCAEIPPQWIFRVEEPKVGVRRWRPRTF
jgi:hypothetical protein